MASQGVLVGIDLGTTNLKAAAFSTADGRLLASASRRLPSRVKEDGTREQPVPQVRAALQSVFTELRHHLGEAASSAIEGIGLAAQGGSGTLVRRDDGEALTPMVLWNDSRAAALLPELAAAKPEAYWQELYQRRGPSMGLARLLWLKRCHPEAFDQDIVYVGAGEIVYYMMTGQWRQDRCNALQLGCYDVLNAQLTGDPLALAGADVETVAPLRAGHQTHPLSEAGAALLGLPLGIPVAGPYMDHEAGFLSAAGAFEEPLQCSLGTAWVGNFEVAQPTSGWSPVQLVIQSPFSSDRSLVIQPLLTGNTSWDWALDCFLGDHDHSTLAKTQDLFDDRLLPPASMTCIPWFTQANPLVPGTRGGGLYSGVTAHCSPEDFVRALAAGLCFEFYRVFEDLKAQQLIDGVVLGGGASKGGYFRAMLAGLFHPLPTVSVADEDLAGARGALTAFSDDISRSKVIEVDAPEESALQALRLRYDHYVRTFAKTYGDHPAGAPYRLR